MLEKARELMISIYIEKGLCDASIKASELVDALLDELEGEQNEK